MSSFPPSSRRLGWLALVLMLLAAAALSIDMDAAKRWKRYPQKGVAYSAAILSEGFGHGLGVGWILLTIVTLDRHRRRHVGPLAVLAFGSGMIANAFKLAVQRWRPLHFRGSDSVWDTFAGWPIAGAGYSSIEHLGKEIQSFPSAHAATATGLAIGLTMIYPRGRWLFISGAVLAALQRQAVRAHFTSDTLAGAAIGCLWAAIWLHPRFLGGAFVSPVGEMPQEVANAGPCETAFASVR
jgi:membrane-associated phospholipid phosphatase